MPRLEEEPLQQHWRDHAEKHRDHEQKPQGPHALTLALSLLWIGFWLPFFMRCHRRAALIRNTANRDVLVRLAHPG
jgi:4-amino-4-deoxy-L-arabinose transferase-like glycosyltransferase